jgi:hypothetical protein
MEQIKIPHLTFPKAAMRRGWNEDPQIRLFGTAVWNTERPLTKRLWNKEFQIQRQRPAPRAGRLTARRPNKLMSE